MTKKTYQKPQLVVYGDVEKITLGGNQRNSDRPDGSATDSDAFPYIR
jgi:hypothetical protein